MGTTLPCACELTSAAVAAADAAIRRRTPLKRLFGLVPRRRRRSGFVTACDCLGEIDLASPAGGREAPLRCASCPPATTIEDDFIVFVNIQDDFIVFVNIQGGEEARRHGARRGDRRGGGTEGDGTTDERRGTWMMDVETRRPRWGGEAEGRLGTCTTGGGGWVANLPHGRRMGMGKRQVGSAML
jgi:hypothetical protein